MQEPFDRRAWAYAMLYLNLYGPQLLYSSRKFGQVILTRTVTQEPQGAHGQKRYPNVSFFLARNGGCIKMPGDEQKSRNRPKNDARSAIISMTMSLQTTVSHELRR